MRLINKAVVFSWLSMMLSMGGFLIVMPLAKVNLQGHEFTFWLFSSTLFASGNLIFSAINESYLRSLTKFSSKENILNQLNTLSLKLSFLPVTVILVVLLYINNGDLGTYLLFQCGILISLSVCIYLLSAGSVAELMRTERVEMVQKIEFFYQFIRVLLSVVFVVLHGGLIGLFAANLLAVILRFIILRVSVSNKTNQNCSIFGVERLDNDVKLYITTPILNTFFIKIGGFLILNSMNIVAMTLPSSEAELFILSTKLIMLAYAISKVPISINLPKLISFRQQNKVADYKKLFYECLSVSILLFIALSLSAFYLAPDFLKIFNVNIELLPSKLLVFMILIYLLELNHVFHSISYETTNHVPFLYISLVSGLSIIALSSFFSGIYGAAGILFSQFVVQLLGNNWYPVYLNVKSLR